MWPFSKKGEDKSSDDAFNVGLGAARQASGESARQAKRDVGDHSNA